MQTTKRFQPVINRLGDHPAMAVVLKAVGHHAIVTGDRPQSAHRERA